MNQAHCGLGLFSMDKVVTQSHSTRSRMISDIVLELEKEMDDVRKIVHISENEAPIIKRGD